MRDDIKNVRELSKLPNVLLLQVSGFRNQGMKKRKLNLVQFASKMAGPWISQTRNEKTQVDWFNLRLNWLTALF